MIVAAGHQLTREVPEDVIVKIQHPTKNTMAIKKGSLVVVDMIAAREFRVFMVSCESTELIWVSDRNPHFFPDPHSFKPSRWYGVSENDTTMFGMGARACIGRKFSQTEAIAFISLFLRTWHVDVVLENNETREQYEERVMNKGGLVGLAFGVTEKINLKLTKRTKASV